MRDQPEVRIFAVSEARILWRGPAGGTGTILAATDPPWATELWRWRLRPGEEFGGQAHAPATREMVWVERGTLSLVVAGQHWQIQPGECARFPGGRPHGYANHGTDPVDMTMVVVIPPATV